MHPVSANTQRPTWCSDVLLAFTMAASGTCRHSARDTRPPLPVDTLDNGYISSVGGIGTTPGGRLKDPADTSRYGVRRANGVIVIRTKGRVGSGVG